MLYEPDAFELAFMKRTEAERVAGGYRWVCPFCGEAMRSNVEPRTDQIFITQCPNSTCERYLVHAKEGKAEN